MHTHDEILYGALTLRQPENGARVNCDTLLLSDFPTLPAKKHAHFVELGSAAGAVSLLLAKRFENLRVTGLEIQEEAVELARLNAIENSLSGRVDFQHFDIKNHRELPAQSFDAVIVNPPYKTLASGRVSTKAAEAIARQETACTLEDVIDAARWLLRSRARFYCVFTTARMAELLVLLDARALEPKRLRFVHTKRDASAGIFLLEALKDGGKGGLVVEPPLCR